MKKHLWITISVGLVVVAILFRLQYVAYVAYAFFLLELLSRVMNYYSLSSLSVTRDLTRTQARIGDSLDVTTTVTNRSILPVPWILLEELLPDRLPKKGVFARLSSLLPGRSVVLKYSIEMKYRGYYQIGPTLVETGDLFGLHRKFRISQNPHYIIVHPKVLMISRYSIASRRPIGEVRITHRIYEDPTRTAGVRDYVVGDPLSRVHWKVSARAGSLQSKIFEPSTLSGATIALDFDARKYPDTVGFRRSELAVTLAASLAFFVYQQKNQIGFLSNGRDAADRMKFEMKRLDYLSRGDAVAMAEPLASSERLAPIFVPTKRGEAQAMRIIEALGRIELTTGLTFEEALLSEFIKLPRDATIIAITSAVPDSLLEALLRLKRSGFAVFVIMVSDVDSFEKAQIALAGHHIPSTLVTSENDLNEIGLFSGRRDVALSSFR